MQTNSNQMPAASTRRGFLSRAAGIAAGGAVLALATIPPASAAAAPASPQAALANASAVSADPIFAAIESHKAARVVVYSAVDAVCARENQLKDEGKRRGDPDREDDAQLKEREGALSLAFHAETDAACLLIDERPTTMTGVMALLQYAVAADTDGQGWPSDLVSDDGDKIRSWQFFLIESLAEVLPGMVLAS